MGDQIDPKLLFDAAKWIVAGGIAATTAWFALKNSAKEGERLGDAAHERLDEWEKEYREELHGNGKIRDRIQKLEADAETCVRNFESEKRAVHEQLHELRELAGKAMAGTWLAKDDNRKAIDELRRELNQKS